LVFLAKFEIFAGERDSTAPDLGEASGLALALALSAVWPLGTFLGAALGGLSSSESLSLKHRVKGCECCQGWSFVTLLETGKGA